MKINEEVDRSVKINVTITTKCLALLTCWKRREIEESCYFERESMLGLNPKMICVLLDNEICSLKKWGIEFLRRRSLFQENGIIRNLSSVKDDQVRFKLQQYLEQTKAICVKHIGQPTLNDVIEEIDWLAARTDSTKQFTLNGHMKFLCEEKEEVRLNVFLDCKIIEIITKMYLITLLFLPILL